MSKKSANLAGRPVSPDASASLELPVVSSKNAHPGQNLMSFKEALDLADTVGRRHLLLGNGFSIALRPDIFTYNTLFEKAQESQKLSSELSKVFANLETTDFELVMEALQRAATLARLYVNENPQLADKFEKDAAILRDVLAETIAENHPSRPYDVSDEQYASCRAFLSNFGGQIYTLNYDLLLYWTLMQSEIQPAIVSDDGFRSPDGHDKEYVTWDVQNTDNQRIHYLHGALHIYDAGPELLKYTWNRTDIPLVEQIRASLNRREYPLIVTEGTSSQKKGRIQHSNFLGRSYRSFAKIRNSLFIYGHSLAENDEHLLTLIDHGKVGKIFVGIYGDPADEANSKVIHRASLIAKRRGNPQKEPEVHFYDAASAHVWDGQGFD